MITGIVKRLGPTVVAALAVTAAIAPYSHAGTFTLVPCVEVTNAWQRLGPPSAPEAWTFVDQCEFQWRFESVVDTSFEAEENWVYPARGLAVESATMRISGSNGSAAGRLQGLRMCELSPDGREPTVCGPLKTLETRGPETVSFSKADGSIPSDDAHLVFTGRCVEPTGCEAGERFDISDVRLTLRDDVKPFLGAALEAPYGSNDFGSTDWHRSGPLVDFWATDEGSGVPRLLYRYYDRYNNMWVHLEVVPGGKNPLTQSFCLVLGADRTAPRFCAQDTSLELGQQWFYFQINTRDMYDGVNKVIVTAYDMADNPSDPVELDLRVDNTPPAAPLAPTMVGPRSDWTGSPTATIRWKNTGETVESTSQSGIAGVRYTMNPLSGQQGQVVGTVGGAIDSLPVTFPAPGRWDIQFRTIDRAGNGSGLVSAKAGYDPLVLDSPETLSDAAMISGQEAVSNTAISWNRPANAAKSLSGICGYALGVNGDSVADPGATINVFGDVTSAPLPPNLKEGRYWVHVRPVSCAGVAGATTIFNVTVDLTAPEASLAAPVAGWLTDSRRVELVADDALSGVSRILHSLDGGPRIESAGATAWAMVPEGVHTLTFQAEDAAGNRSAERATSISVDRTPPTVAFEPPDPGRPTLVKAQAADGGSGIESIVFEYKAEDSGSWTTFPSPVRLSRSENAGEAVASVIFPDATLPHGRYQLRAFARDRAGLWTVTRLNHDGTPADVELPLRTSTTLTGGVSPVTRGVKCGSSRTVCAKSTGGRYIVDYGRPVRIDGRLLDSDGAAIQRAPVRLFTAVGAAQLKLWSTATTDSRGRYEFLLPAAPSRRVEVRFAGTETLLHKRVAVEVLTRAKVSLHVAVKRKNGFGFVFGGRVHTAGAEIPRQGKTIVVQLRGRRGWLNFPGSIKTRADGRFEKRMSYGKIDEPLRFAFRAVVPGELGWPFVWGASSTVTRTLKP